MESEPFREWKRLRAQARTADEFDQLTRWCQAQVELYESKAAGYEAELKTYRADPSARSGDPLADDKLKMAIEYCRELSRHWAGLASEIRQKTAV